MTKGYRRAFNVSYHKDAGFQLHLFKEHKFRAFLMGIADSLDALSGHRLCYRDWFIHFMFWTEAKDIDLGLISITEEHAVAISEPGTWDWFTEEDEEEELEVTERGA